MFVKAGGYCHSPFEDYIDQIEIIKELTESEKRGEFVVIKDFDQLDTYDTFLLMIYLSLLI